MQLNFNSTVCLEPQIIFHKEVAKLQEHLSPEILPDYIEGKLTHEEFSDGSIVQKILKKEKSKNNKFR